MGSDGKVLGGMVVLALVVAGFLFLGVFFIYPLLALFVSLVFIIGGIIWLLIPCLLYWKLQKLADLTAGPILTALHWWVVSVYGIAVLMWAALSKIGRMDWLGLFIRFHVLLWLGPMLLALLPAWYGFRRWHKSKEGEQA
jgi:hypothetical protein